MLRTITPRVAPLRGVDLRVPAAVALRAPRRHYTDKILLGSASALCTCGTTVGVFHLLVTPVSGTIAASTLAMAAASGALSVVDGGKESSGTTFGAVMGVFCGVIGGFYAKSSVEPWRK